MTSGLGKTNNILQFIVFALTHICKQQRWFLTTDLNKFINFSTWYALTTNNLYPKLYRVDKHALLQFPTSHFAYPMQRITAGPAWILATVPLQSTSIPVTNIIHIDSTSMHI